MTNKIAIITGGSRGLGRNTAVNLARRGVDILFTWRANQKEAESLVSEVENLGRKAAGFRLDTGDVRAFDEFVAAYAAHCGTVVAHGGHPGPLLSDRWYDDGAL